ncbi:putative salicylate hydroxylase [Seiridium unicorne]|uniref:Salicylate hydroxylase n=1 Tax=Seiridium unicorne TaxID=138068 RepID=A0ABR2UWT4_9PEZI
MGDISTTASKFRIAIIGSGPIGKLLACSSITHPDVEIVQYEADKLPLRPSFGYGVGPQSLRGFKVANRQLGQKIYDACITARTFMRFYHAGDEDRLLAEPYMPDKSVHGWIGRDELLEILDMDMPESVGPVQYGKQLSSIAKVGGKVRLDFQDGSQDTVNAVWACDGLNSLCRKALQGSQYRPPVYSGRIAFRGKVSSEKVTSELGVAFAEETYMFIGVQGWHILTFPILGGDVINIAAFCVEPEYKRLGRDAKLTKDDILAYFPRRNKTADMMLHLMIDFTPGGCQRLDMTHLGQLGAFTDSELPITLFGDAANAMTPHIAGSMSTGIVGVATFILEWNSRLQTSELEIATTFNEASKIYDAKHRPVAQELVDRSFEQGGLWSGAITDADKLMEHPKFLWHIADHLDLPEA